LLNEAAQLEESDVKLNASEWARHLRTAPRNMQRYLNGSRGMPVEVAAEFVQKCRTLGEAQQFLNAVASARKAYCEGA
jgi:hypothetical protein